MKTYQAFRARMKGQVPSNWSSAGEQGTEKTTDTKMHVAQFGTGLEDIDWDTADASKTQVNPTLYQSYEWHTPSSDTRILLSKKETSPASDNHANCHVRQSSSSPSFICTPSHYSVLTSLLPSLAAFGITSVWLPPGCKATGPQDNGYGIYDLYDLGEFDAKDGLFTKWGSKAQLVELGKKAEQAGIGLLWDAVLNHRAKADDKEKARAVTCHRKDRTIEISPPQDVETWTVFTYPARKGQYSDMHYNWRHFSGIDWDDRTHTSAILRFVGDAQTIKPGWSTAVDNELGNYDYLMFADVDYSQPSVRSDVLHWASWLPTQVPGLKGMRLDAIKHYDATFQYELIKHLRSNPQTKSWSFIGEYWSPESTVLADHIDKFAGHMQLFDVKLVYNLSDFSHGRLKDLRQIFKGSLVDLKPHHAVTFVTNHDTQPQQSLAAPVQDWFVPHAYALILLRPAGTPCVFHGHIYGILGPEPHPPCAGGRLMRLVLARNLYAYGPQHDYFDRASCVGWTREGIRTNPPDTAHNSQDPRTTISNPADPPRPATQTAGLAVLLSISWSWTEKKMYVGHQHAGETWTDLMSWSWERVRIDADGHGVFRVGPRGVGIWTAADASARSRVDGLVWPEELRGQEEKCA